MGYAILRIQKLKSAVAVHRSLKHAFREQNTPNADPERTPDNDHHGATSAREAMTAFRARLPERFRKDAVQCVEYLLTGSPEDMKGKSRQQQDAYFADALTWLKAKHGAENVVYAGVHRDETTPHMYAYVVPRVGDKLNARSFFGGAKALNTMQTDFANQVGLKHGLQRGLEGSKARHKSIKQYYGHVIGKTPPAPRFSPPSSYLPGENPNEYVKRAINSALELANETISPLFARSLELDKAREQIDATRKTLKANEQKVKAVEMLLGGLSPVEQRKLLEAAAVAKKDLLKGRGPTR